MAADSNQLNLKRSLKLPLVAFYGLGTILGAGIYVLVGKVAGYAGMLAPFAFLFAALIATLSALSYAELVSRFPKSAGEAIYVQKAFGRPSLSLLVGLSIVSVGIVSTSTLVRGLLGYLQTFIVLPDPLVIVLTAIGIGLIVSWGIGESVLIAALMTVLEMLGLVIIIWVARDNLFTLPDHLPALLPRFDLVVWQGVLLGAFVAFYAFIGYEDMVNIAEEVIEPQKTIPRGIIVALVLTTLFYLLVSLAAVLSLPLDKLAASDAPLAAVYEHLTGEQARFISAISIVSVLNGALVQVIMGSRILYGLSRQGRLPVWLGEVHPRTRTPVKATVLITAVVLVLSLFVPLVSLATITSLITLLVFAVVNLALWAIKGRTGIQPAFSVPRWVPLTGFIASLGFVATQLVAAGTS
jgi:amino acid transporter